MAAAKQMALHGSAQTEDSSTKDTTGDRPRVRRDGTQYDITGSGLVLTPSDTLLTGANRTERLRERGLKTSCSTGVSASWRARTTAPWSRKSHTARASVTNLQIQAQNKQNAQYNYTLNGYGPIVPGTGTKTVAKTSGDK